MPATPNYNITYPNSSVAPNVPLVMQNLAESVDLALTGIQASTTSSVALGGLYNHYTSTGAYGSPKHTKSFNKTVSTTGMIGTTGTTITMTAGTQYLIGTIPFGYRPAFDQIIRPVTSNTMGSGTLYIRANGDLQFETTATFTNVAKGSFFISLDNIQWQAA